MRSILVLFIGLLACQTPTRVRENPPGVKLEDGALQTGTVLLDARPHLQYAAGHVPGAILVRWQDFPADQDFEKTARRLSWWGIHPDTSVLILGLGAEGDGSEGRLLWLLRSLGLKNVRVERETKVLGKRVLETPEPMAVPIWIPTLDDSRRVDRAEFSKLLRQPAVRRLDVRTAPERKARPFYFSTTALEWTEFFKPEIQNRLRSLGWSERDRVVVLSDRGVRSAWVTEILRDLGYGNAANYAGGYSEWVSKKTAGGTP